MTTRAVRGMLPIPALPARGEGVNTHPPRDGGRREGKAAPTPTPENPR